MKNMLKGNVVKVLFQGSLLKKAFLVSVLVLNGVAFAAHNVQKNSEEGSFADMAYTYCSHEDCDGLSSTLEAQFNCLETLQERQLVAARLQLKLLKAPDEVLQKFEASEEWKTRTSDVICLLENLELDESNLIPVYQRCFEAIDLRNRVVPWFEELMQPSTLARRAFRSGVKNEEAVLLFSSCR